MLQQYGPIALIGVLLATITAGLVFKRLRVAQIANKGVLGAIAAIAVLAVAQVSQRSPATIMTVSSALIPASETLFQSPGKAEPGGGMTRSEQAAAAASPAPIAEPSLVAQTEPRPVAGPLRAAPDPSTREELESLRAQVAALQAAQIEARERLRQTQVQLAAARADAAKAKAQLAQALAASRREPAETAGPTTTEPKRVEVTESAAGRSASTALKSRMEAGISAPSFELLPVSGSLVTGLKGSYYRVTLIDPQDGSRFVFKRGRYEMREKEQRVLAAIEALRKDVLDKLGPGTARVFIEGLASPAIFAHNYALDARDTSLGSAAYLPRLAGGGATFAAMPAKLDVTGPYFNEHLPTLRGAYVQQLLEGATGGPIRSELLQGEFLDGQHTASRSFEIVLLVNW